MGLLDRMIRNVANDVLSDAVRQVERTASQAISEKVSTVVEDYTDSAKATMAEKKVELRDRIIEESENHRPYEILPNTDKSETLRFASKKKVKYHYIDEEKGIDTFVPMAVVGGMTYQIELSGKYEGCEDVAYDLSQAAYAGLQKVLDEEITPKHTAPEDIKQNHAITITKLTKSSMDDICNRYKIPQRTMIFTVIHPADTYDTSKSGGSNGPTWSCTYCGCQTSGNICEYCGAPRN